MKRHFPLKFADSNKLVVIPTYNEKENIEKIIMAIYKLWDDFNILVVDDASPDGTAQIVNELAVRHMFYGRLFIIERPKKLGLGTAYIAGFKWALAWGYEYVFEMDADFSHNPTDLKKLYEACCTGGADVAVGSRYCNGISVINWPIGRVVMSYYASWYARKVLGMPIYDCTAGFVCYSRKVLSSIDFQKIRMHGYGFQIEMKYTAYRLGFKIKEVPIIFEDRKEGKSKMSSGIFGEAFWGVLKMRFRKFIRKKADDEKTD